MVQIEQDVNEKKARLITEKDESGKSKDEGEKKKNGTGYKMELHQK